jgi:sugar/nucleoside kinase (ribokinase family)
MANSPNNVVFTGRGSLDVSPGAGTQVEVHDRGVNLTNPSGLAKFIATHQTPTAGSKVEAIEPLDGLVGSGLVGQPQVGGGAPNATMEAIHEAREYGESRISVHLLVENKESGDLSNLARQEGFAVSYGRLSDIPVNLVYSQAGDRTIVKSRLSPPASCRTFGHFADLATALRQASVLAFVSPSNPTMVAASMALSNGAMKIAQPTGALDLATTVLMLTGVDDLVVSYDDLLKLGLMTGFSLEDPGTESSSQAVETVLRTLRFLRDLRLAGSVSSAVTLGKGGCIAADWRLGRIERIGLELFEQVPTRSGAGDTFLGAWVYFRAMGLGPAEAAVRATRRVVEWHGLKPDQYQIRSNRLGSR